VAQQTDRPWYPDQPAQGLALDPVAAGQPSANPIDYAAAVQQGAASATGQPVVAPAQAQSQGQSAQQQRGRTTWSSPGETVAFTNDDFYPNPQDPAQYNYDTGLEVVARPGRLPMTAISKAATILNNRQVELDKKKAELQEALVGKKFSTHKSYQQNFNRIIQNENNEFVKSVADAYTGGDINKAYKVIAGSPTLMSKFRDMNNEHEALGQRGLFLVEKANDYLTNAATNKGHFTKEGAALARDILYGMGGYSTGDKTGGDFKKLMENAKQFENIIGKEQYVVDQVDPHMKEFAKLTTTVDPATGEPYAFKRGNGYVFLTESNYKDFESQKEFYAREMAYKLGYGSYEEVKKDLDELYPASYEAKTKMDERTIPSGGGGGGATAPAGPTAAAGFEVTGSAENPDERRTLAPTYTSGKREKQYEGVQLQDAAGNNTTVGNIGFAQKGKGSWTITGKQLNNSITAKFTEYGRTGNPAILKEIETEINSLPDINIPITPDNEARILSLFPEWNQELTENRSYTVWSPTKKEWVKTNRKPGDRVPLGHILQTEWNKQYKGQAYGGGQSAAAAQPATAPASVSWDDL
jgi:hypothetical protein